MPVTAHDWVRIFAAATNTPPTTANRYAQSLKAAGLFPRPANGNAAWRTRPEATHIANYLIAVAAPTGLDAPNVVIRLRALRFRVAVDDRPYLPGDTFGDVLTSLIADQACQHSGEGERFAAPSQILLSADPAAAELLWFGSDGALIRRHFYGERPDRAVLTRRVGLGAGLIELAASALVIETPSKQGAPRGPREVSMAA